MRMVRLSMIVVLLVAAGFVDPHPTSQVNETTAAESIKFLSDDLSQFSHKLYVEIARRKSGNFAFSPLSLHSALSLLLLGATQESQTQGELLSLLGRFIFQGKQESLIEAYRHLLDSYGRSSLRFGTRLWVNQGFDVLDNYEARVARMGTEVVKLDTASADAAQSINRWVAELTDNQITRIINDLDPSTQLVLGTAVSIKEKWNVTFSESKSTFFLADNSRKHVETIQRTDRGFKFGRFRYGVSKTTYDVLVIPYKNSGLEMTIILPPVDQGVRGLALLEQQLEEEIERCVYTSPRQTQAYLNIFRTVKESVFELRRDIEVSIPKFKFEVEIDAKEILQQLGVKTVFTDMSELGGMTNQTNLKVQQVVHKTRIAVDEEGTEASAATVIKIVPLSAVFDDLAFIADRPFLFTIHDNVNDIPLLVGRVVDPTQ